MGPVRGKNVVVTGASRGLGTYIARAFAAEGAHLALVARNATALEVLAEELRSLGVRAIAVAADLADVQGYGALLDRIERELGPIDVLVNNAGLEANSAYAEFAPQRIEELLRVDLLAPMLLTRALLPRLLLRGSGHVVNIASVAGKSPSAYNVTYAAAKSGLIAFSESLRAELHKTGVGVSVVSPGFIADAGMYAEKLVLTGKAAPKLAGVSSPALVARNVVKAVVKNCAEIIVSPGPIRLFLAINQLFPGFMAFVSRVLGVNDVFTAVVDAEKRAAEQSVGAPPPA
ncbi:MAG: Short-chain dehydrogenase/reductase [Myxococcaceae bacterium]|nr:Short-chain dehydrogenase/reductase [Myxococcaceae bacterium]